MKEESQGRVTRARTAYAVLIPRIHGVGYLVDTYQFPFLDDERKVHYFWAATKPSFTVRRRTLTLASSDPRADGSAEPELLRLF